MAVINKFYRLTILTMNYRRTLNETNETKETKENKADENGFFVVKKKKTYSRNGNNNYSKSNNYRSNNYRSNNYQSNSKSKSYSKNYSSNYGKGKSRYQNKSEPKFVAPKDGEQYVQHKKSTSPPKQKRFNNNSVRIKKSANTTTMYGKCYSVPDYHKKALETIYPTYAIDDSKNGYKKEIEQFAKFYILRILLNNRTLIAAGNEPIYPDYNHTLDFVSHRNFKDVIDFIKISLLYYAKRYCSWEKDFYKFYIMLIQNGFEPKTNYANKDAVLISGWAPFNYLFSIEKYDESVKAIILFDKERGCDPFITNSFGETIFKCLLIAITQKKHKHYKERDYMYEIYDELSLLTERQVIEIIKVTMGKIASSSIENFNVLRLCYINHPYKTIECIIGNYYSRSSALGIQETDQRNIENIFKYVFNQNQKKTQLEELKRAFNTATEKTTNKIPRHEIYLKAVSELTNSYESRVESLLAKLQDEKITNDMYVDKVALSFQSYYILYSYLILCSQDQIPIRKKLLNILVIEMTDNIHPELFKSQLYVETLLLIVRKNGELIDKKKLLVGVNSLETLRSKSTKKYMKLKFILSDIIRELKK